MSCDRLDLKHTRPPPRLEAVTHPTPTGDHSDTHHLLHNRFLLSRPQSSIPPDTHLTWGLFCPVPTEIFPPSPPILQPTSPRPLSTTRYSRYSLTSLTTHGSLRHPLWKEEETTHRSRPGDYCRGPSRRARILQLHPWRRWSWFADIYDNHTGPAQAKSLEVRSQEETSKSRPCVPPPSHSSIDRQVTYSLTITSYSNSPS